MGTQLFTACSECVFYREGGPVARKSTRWAGDKRLCIRKPGGTELPEAQDGCAFGTLKWEPAETTSLECEKCGANSEADGVVMYKQGTFCRACGPESEPRCPDCGHTGVGVEYAGPECACMNPDCPCRGVESRQT